MKECKICNITTTTKWFNGPICRKCYRQLPHNREKEIKNMQQYKLQNRNQILLKKKEWRSNNPNYELNRLKIDPLFKLKKRLRTRLNHAIVNIWKSGSAVSDLGCSIEELKLHLESLFEPGMTWKNYGKWHLDHKRPLSSFDLKKREELLEACNYKNLQPLWAKDNLKKGSKYVNA